MTLLPLHTVPPPADHAAALRLANAVAQERLGAATLRIDMDNDRFVFFCRRIDL